MLGWQENSFQKSFKITSDGISEFTMEQIQAKAAAMGLTEELTAQAVAMASDANFTAKAKTGKLKWIDAVNDSKVDLDELSNALRKTGKISDANLDWAKDAGNIDVYRKRLTGLIEQNAELADSFIDLGTASKSVDNNLGKGLLASLKSFALSPVGLMSIATAIGAIVVALDDAMHLDQEEAFSALSSSLDEYNSSASQLDSLNQELETTKARIQELQGLQANGTITLSEEAELTKLQSQNAELERKISLQEKLVSLQSQQAINDAKDALDAKSLSVAESVKAGDTTGTHSVMGTAGETTSLQAAKDDLAAIEEYEKKISDKEKSIIDTKEKIAYETEQGDFLSAWFGKFDLSSQEKELENYQKSLDTLNSDLSTQTEYLQTQLDALKLDPTANADAIREIESVLNQIAGVDLSPTESKLQAVKDFFEGTESHNFLKDEMIEVAKSGGDVAKALQQAGIDISALGMDAETVNRYFKEMASSAEEAAQAVSGVDGSFEGVQSAFESANNGAEWSSMADYIQQAKELYEAGKVGTDDFQTVAQWMVPDKIDEDAYKYDADAYVAAWESAYDRVIRYFDAENPLQSMTNFTNDLVNAGKAFNDNGDITWGFKTSAEAADALGLSVEAVEAAMHNLEDYGAEFDDVMFSGEGLERYRSALDNIKTLYDSMEEGESKNRLEGLISGWESEYSQYEQDLSTLTEDQIVHIEFEYDLATIQQQIDELKSQAEAGGDSQTWAELIAGQKSYREKSEEGLGLNVEGIQIPVQYTDAEDAIANLQSQLMNATDGEKVQIQAEISNLYDIQNDLLNAFDSSELSWDDFLQTDNAKSILSDLSSSTEEAMQNVAEILGMDVEDLKIKVDADTSDAEEKVNGIISEDGKTIVMNVDATTDDVKRAIDNLEQGQTIVFTADVDGVERGIEGVKNADGTITYTTEIDGKYYEIQSVDGTANYTLGDSPKEVPDASGDANYDLGSHPTSAPDVPGTANYSGKFPSFAPTLSGVVNYTARIIGGIGSLGQSIASKFSGSGSVNGTAHIAGTVRRGTALLSGDWSVQQSERALLGELGPETIVRDGKFFTVGDNGAEFANVRKGDVIFNHKQTEELFKNGYVTSGGGRAKVVGGAYLEGSAYANGWRLPSGSSGSSSGGSSGGSSSSANKAAKAATSAANAANNAADATSKAADEFKEKFDEVEIWLDRFDRTLNNLTDSIEAYSYDLSKQSSVSDQAINHIRNNLATLQSAYNRYIQEANSVGLDASWQERIKNGSINITEITDEELSDKLSEYQDWYEKALDVQDTIAEMQKELLDLAVEKLENIDQYYENREEYDDNFGYLTSIDNLASALDTYRKELDKQINNGVIKEGSNQWFEAMNTIADREQELFEAMIKKYQDIIDNLDRISTTLDNSLSLKEARDEPITEQDYQRPMEVANEQIDSLFEKRQKLLEQQAIYDVGSELYDDLADQIADIDDDIYGLLEDVEDLKDKIWEVRWQPFFDGQEALSDLVDETDEFRDLLHDDAFIGEFGGLTTEGLTNVALISQSINASKQQIRNYQEAIQKLTEDYENGNISTSEYEENLQSFLESIRSGVSDVEDFRMEIVDLYTDMLEKENEVIQDSIDKHKELLQVKKDNDDYARNVRNQTKDINAIQAQISALESVNNESAKAELKRLQAELAEAQDELSQTQKDREYEIRQAGYDGLSEDLNDALEDTLNSVKYNASEQERVISEMLNRVVTNYEQAYDRINQIIGNTGFTPSDDFQQNIDNLGDAAGSQNQINDSNTIAPDYTPDDFTNINTGQIQSDSNQSHNDAIESEIEKEPNVDNRPVAQLTLKPTSITIQEGKTAKLTATIRPTDAANKNVVWTSSNTSVATVSGGTVKGVKPGSATITCAATDGSGKSATASVTVTQKPKPSKPKPSGGGDGVLRVGDRITFTGSYYYDSWGQRPAGNLYSGVPNGVIVDSYSASKYGGSSSFTGGYDVHIRSADGKYGDLGWVSIGQLKGYKSGTLGVDKDQLAKVNEAGKEMIIRAGGSQLTHLQYGDAVIPNPLAHNLFTLSSNTSAIMSNLHRSMPNGAQQTTVVNNHYDSLLTVHGDIDKDTFPGVKKMCEQAFNYTSKKLYQDAGLMGIKKKI